MGRESWYGPLYNPLKEQELPMGKHIMKGDRAFRIAEVSVYEN